MEPLLRQQGSEPPLPPHQLLELPLVNPVQLSEDSVKQPQPQPEGSEDLELQQRQNLLQVSAVLVPPQQQRPLPLVDLVELQPHLPHQLSVVLEPPRLQLDLEVLVRRPPSKLGSADSVQPQPQQVPQVLEVSVVVAALGQEPEELLVEVRLLASAALERPTHSSSSRRSSRAGAGTMPCTRA